MFYQTSIPFIWIRSRDQPSENFRTLSLGIKTVVFTIPIDFCKIHRLWRHKGRKALLRTKKSNSVDLFEPEIFNEQVIR